VREAREEGVRLASPRAAAALARAVARAVDEASTQVSDATVEAAIGMVQLARELDLGVDVGVAQELVYDAVTDDRLAPEDRGRLVPLAQLLGVAAGG
jgi:hypothetical protein